MKAEQPVVCRFRHLPTRMANENGQKYIWMNGILFIDASKVEGKKATVDLHSILHNSGKEKVTAHLKIQIFSPQGEEVYSTTQPVNISGETNIPISLTFDIKKPELWSVDSPSLYTAHLSVKSKKLSDEITVPFGIRTVEFSAEKGFLLMGNR